MYSTQTAETEMRAREMVGTIKSLFFENLPQLAEPTDSESDPFICLVRRAIAAHEKCHRREF
jgi:hypothetical protein